MTKFLFIVDPNKTRIDDAISRIFYFIYNNRTTVIDQRREMLISVVSNQAEIKKQAILEGDHVELFSYSGNTTITKYAFELLTIAVEKLNEAKIKDCDIHIIT